MIPKKETVHLISPSDLSSLDGVLVDIRTPEAFAEARLPGSVNHCVYEVAFMDSFPEAYPDRDTPLVVYGDGDPYQADLAAVGRLHTLGYTNVSVLDGGLRQWTAEDRETEGSGPAPAPSPAGRYTLDTERTALRWVGRNLANQHNGSVEAAGGFLELDDEGRPVAAAVEVDLTRMTCEDITDTSMAGMLIGHLQSADFFDVEQFPDASFRLSSTTPIEGANYGQPNFRVEGSISARGQTTPVSLEALIEPVEDGVVFQSNFDLDRVALGACYGSGRIFERLGMHLVNDLVSLDVAAVFAR
jgi:polyisoprenoid-binding protein YceI